MHEVLTVFKKELIDTLRDRRTLLAMVAFPLLLFPALIFGTIWIARGQAEEAATKTLKVAVVNSEVAPGFLDRLTATPQIDAAEGIPRDSARARVQREELDAAFAFAPTFQRNVEALKAGNVSLIYKSGDLSDIILRRLNGVLDAYEQDLLTQRFSTLDLSLDATQAVTVNEVDVATSQERVAQLAGRMLPYLFILFCFIGALYPALDLGAGEKERGTLETLLTTPANRFQILVGKFATLTLTGVCSAFIAFGSIMLSMQFIEDIPPTLLKAANNIVTPSVVGLLLSMLVPLTMFFAAAQLSLSFYAKSFKEAQSTIQPLLIAVILPAVIGMMPGIELNTVTALIPVLNVSLATKDIMAGTIAAFHLILVYGSLIALAAIAVVICTQLFKQESIIFRT